MALRELGLEQASVVIAYDAIDRGQVSRDRLKDMIPEGEAQFIDTPGGPLIVVFEAVPGTSCIINARRIHVNQGGPVEPGDGYLAQMATVANEAIRGAAMVAYGLNFGVKASVESIDNIGQFLRDKFLRGLQDLEATVGGTVSWLSPNFKYVIGGIEYQLRMGADESDPALLRANLNVHHEVGSLPSRDDLSQEIREEFQRMSQLLDRLLSR